MVGNHGSLGLGSAGLLLLLLDPLPAGAESWPQCQQHSVVFRHAGSNGLFADLVALGAKEGCWLSDCTKSDKFICPSPAECADACSRIDLCRFWTYEPGIRKCFLRSSDAGREDHPDFVSGTRTCWPGQSQSQSQGYGLARGPEAEAEKVAVPFAQAALWASQQPALRACGGGIGSPGCDNPYAAMGVWRYAVNNLRLAVGGLPEEERQRHGSTLQYVRQISEDVANFFRQPTGESFQIAVTNAGQVFEALGGWLAGAPPVSVSLRPGLGGQSRPQPAELKAGLGLAARVELADGWKMPLVGFGTWQLLGQQAYDATLEALRLGYRHIDTAQAYMNEREVGAAIRDSGLPRQELFIVTKISDPGDFENLEQRLLAQLAALGTDYLDLYMLHSPEDKTRRERAWRIMEAMQRQGRVRSLGVSNFGTQELQELLDFAQTQPVYVQNKFSVYNPGEQLMGSVALLPFARERGIQVMGYSVINPWPFLLPPMQDPHVRAVAERCGRSPAQVLHRWALQQGVAVIPKSSTAARIRENAQLFDFELSAADMRLLDGLVVLSESNAGSILPAWAEDVFHLGDSVL